jgi:hypothetical protein
MRSLSWSHSSFTALTLRAKLSYARVMPPMASSCIAAVSADVRVARTRPPMPLPKRAARRSCTPPKNAAVCAASRARRCPIGSKQSSSASSLTDPPCLHQIPKIPRPRSWSWMNCGHLCSQKRTISGLGLPCAARRDRWLLLRWGIGACRTCQRLWEALPQGDRQGHCETSFWAAYVAVIPEEQHTAVGLRDGRNRPRGAVEQPLAPTPGPFCAHDVLVFQVGGDA